MSSETIHLTHITPKFPREFSAKSEELDWFSRSPIWDVEDYLKRISLCNTKMDCYVSVYGFSEYDNNAESVIPTSAIIDTIYIDLDDDVNTPPHIWSVYKETRSLVELLIDAKFTPRVYFSGNKGFNVYIDFQIVKLKHSSETIRAFVNSLERVLNLKTLDDHVKGDLMRVSRIPNTMNMVSGLFCIPFTIEEFFAIKGENEILELAKQPRTDEGFTLERNESKPLSDIIKDIDNKIECKAKKTLYKRRGFRRKKKTTKKIRTCIKKLMGGAMEGKKLGHKERLVITFELLKLDWSDHDIAMVFSEQVDYNEKITLYYIRQARGKKYNRWSCERLRNELKICFEDCPIRKKQKLRKEV